jgi:uncharacterized membrane protein
LALALVILLLPLPASATTSVAAPATAPWWPPGQTGLGEGFHLRVPVTITNDRGYPIANGAVSAGIDIAAKLAQAGWTKSPSGGRDLLKGFHLDRDSVRVVAMTDSWQLKAVDPSFTDPSDARRYEVPSLHFAGADNDDYTSPNVTVVWRVAGTLESGAHANFMVYFDSDLTNQKKTAPDYEGSLAGADVDGLFWSGPGLTLYGFVRPANGQAGTVQVIATQPGTHVQAFTGALTSAGQFQAFQPLSIPEVDGHSSFSLGAQEGKTISVSSGAPVAVKLVADRPILAESVSAGFVPSIDGGMTGKSFLFSLRHPTAWEQDTVYFTKTGPDSTSIRVDRVDRSDPTFPRFVTLANAPPYRYSTGWRASMEQQGGSCSADHAQGLPAGPGTYKVTVTTGGRVLVQLQPTDGLFQVPTLQGAPAGREFWAAPDWTDDQFAGGTDCRVVTRVGDWFAAADEDVAQVAVTNPESSIQLDPRGDLQSAAYPPPRSIEGGAQLAGPFHAAMADRPLLFTSSQDLRLFAGPYPAQIGTKGSANYPLDFPAFGSPAVPVIHGPLGGSGGGLRFTGAGASVVFAPFDGTVLNDLDITRLRSDEQLAGIAMSADSSYIVKDSQSDLVKAYTLRSNLPVVVYPMGASAGFFAGVPAFLSAAVGPAQFRGYLLGLSSASGLDPVVGSGTPGALIHYALKVTNLGHSADGSGLPDNVQLSVDTGSLPSGWQADLDVAGSVALAGGQAKPFTLTVHAPSSAKAGEQAVVAVHAVSLGNPLVQDAVQTVTFIKQSFGVALWFNQVDGPTTSFGKVKEGVATFDLVVKNTGSVRDTIQLQADLDEPGWTAVLRSGSADVSEVTLDGGESTHAALDVHPPDGKTQGLAYVTVTATSRSAPSMQDVVRAEARLVEASNLKLVADDIFHFVDPGALAAFNLTLSDSSDVDLISTELQAGAAPGWESPKLLDGKGDPLPAQVSFPKDTPIRVVAQAPANGTAGSSITIRFSAHVGADGVPLEAILFARIRAVHDLETSFAAVPLDLARLAQNVSVEMRVANHGDLDEILAASAAELPIGWSLGAPSDVLVPRGATQLLRFNVSAPAATPPGSYEVKLRLVAQDGNQTVVSLPVLVGAVGGQTVAAGNAQPVQPGQDAAIAVPVSNEGNTPLHLTITPQAGEPWRLGDSQEILLRPGEHATVVLPWEVPADAPDGPAGHTAILHFLAEGTTDPRTEKVTNQFDVGRADLSVGSASALASPGGILVRAVVANHGVRPARDFTVDLVVKGQTIDQMRVGDLPSNATAQLSFLQLSPGDATIVVDGNHTVVESDESNNGRAVVAAADGKASPAVGPAVALLLVLVAALRRKDGG